MNKLPAKLTEAQLDQILADILTHREQFLDAHLNCPLCGSELLLTHVTHFANHKTNEEAHCDACQVRIRAEEHILQ